MADQGNETRLTLRIETKGDPNAARRAGEADARAYNEAFAKVAAGGTWKSPTTMGAGGKPTALLPTWSQSTAQARLQQKITELNRIQEARRTVEIERAQRMAASAPPPPPPSNPPRPVTPVIFAGGGGGGGGGGSRGPDITETTRALGQASRNVRAITGNPFEVLSTFSQSLTGVRKLRVAIDQVSIELQNLSTAYRNEKDAAKRASLRREINSKKVEAAGLVSQTQGAGFKARAVADFAVSNFITTGFLFTGFTVMQNAFNAIAGALFEFGANLLDTGRQARLATDAFAEALKSAGGATQFAKELNLVPGSKLAIFASTVELSQTASQQLGLFGKAAQAYGLSGGQVPVFSESDVGEFKKGLFSQFVKEPGPFFKDLLPGAGLSTAGTVSRETAMSDLAAIDTRVKQLIGNYEDPRVRAALTAVTDQAIAEQRRLVESGYQETLSIANPFYGGVTRLTQVVDDISKLIGGRSFAAAYSSAVQGQTLVGGIPPAVAASVQNLQGLFASSGILSRSQMSPLQRAQDALNRAQAAASGAAASSQIADARRKVGQAGVATAGDTIFDVAQRIINAQGEVDKVKQQAAMQNNIARLTNKVATEKTVEDSMKALQAIKDDAATLAPDVAKALSEQLIKIKVEGADDRISKGLADLIQYVLNLSTKSGSVSPRSGSGSGGP